MINFLYKNIYNHFIRMQNNKIISNESILLDIDCKRMLRRRSKEKIVFEVLQKLELINNQELPEKVVKGDQSTIFKYIFNFFGCLKK